MNPRLSKISFIFFLIVAVLGSSIRLMPLIRVPLVYTHAVHAHSHIAFQGWIYTLLFLLLTQLFLSENQIREGRYALQFKITLPLLLGILIAFSLQGYALYSILFSTLFQLMNYWFIYRFLTDSKADKKDNLPLAFIRTGLWLGLLSTLAPWAIGILAAKGMGQSEAYRSAVYFFLHFQYNGWFLFLVFGLFFKWLEQEQIDYKATQARRFYLLMTYAVFPAYTLSLLGMSFGGYLLVPSAAAAVLQVLGLIAFIQAIAPGASNWLEDKRRVVQLFLYTAFASFILKTGLQILSVFPVFKPLAFENRNIIIGYMHLNLIGILSIFLIALVLHLDWLKWQTLTRLGAGLLLFGFLVTEILLVWSGLTHQPFHALLAVFSVIMALGIACLMVGGFKVRGEKIG